MLPTHRQPTSPGEILREEFLGPNGITQAQLAHALGVSMQTVNLLINGKRAVTADTALGLADVFDTTPEFWMNLQAAVDLWLARRRRESAARASVSGRERHKSGTSGPKLFRALAKGKLVSVARVPARRHARKRARGAASTPAHRGGHDP